MAHAGRTAYCLLPTAYCLLHPSHPSDRLGPGTCSGAAVLAFLPSFERQIQAARRPPLAQSRAAVAAATRRISASRSMPAGPACLTLPSCISFPTTASIFNDN